MISRSLGDGRRSAAAMAAAAVTGTLVVSGCVPGLTPDDAATSGKSLVWDVSEGHTTDDVPWPAEGTAFLLGRGVQVKLTLPEGRVFSGRVEKAMGYRQDKVVKSLDLFYPATTTGKAYKHAKRLGAEWNINMRNIDAWYERRLEQRDAGKEDFSDTAFTGGPHSEPLGGPGGPAPTVEVLNSFSEKRPVVVNLSFVWRRSGHG